MRTGHCIQGGIKRHWWVAVLFATLGCDVPPPFEYSPLDPGTDSFAFPAEQIVIGGSTKTRLSMFWTTRSTSLLQFRIERGVDEEAIGPYVELDGSARAYEDLNVSPMHSYRYRVTAVGPIGLSRPATRKAVWQTNLLFQSHELVLATSSPIVDVAVNDSTSVRRILVSQADGTVAVYSYNGVNFIRTSSRVFAPVPSGVSISSSVDYVALTADSTLKIVTPLLQTVFSARVQAALRSPSFSPRGSQVLAGGSDGRLRIWTTPSGTLADSIQVPGGGIVACEASRNGEVIATLSADGSVRCYRASDLAPLGTSFSVGATGLSLDPSGSFVAVMQAGVSLATVFRTADGSTAGTYVGPPNMRRAVFSPASAELLMVGDDPGLRIVNVMRNMAVGFPTDLRGTFRAIAGGEYGRLFALARTSNRVSVWYGETQWQGVSP